MKTFKIIILLITLVIPLNITNAVAITQKTSLNEVTTNEILKYIIANNDDNDDDALMLTNIRIIDMKSRRQISLKRFNELALNNLITINDSNINKLAKRFTITYQYINDNEKNVKAVKDVKKIIDSVNIKLSGIFSTSIEVPVLRSTTAKGDIVKESDITYIQIEKRRLRNNTIKDIDEIIGKELTRSVKENTAILSNYIQKPRIVKKNELISILYRTKNLEIKTIGKALESGGVEDIIKVKNIRSGAIIQAIIIRKGVAIVNYNKFLHEKSNKDGVAIVTQLKDIVG